MGHRIIIDLARPIERLLTTGWLIIVDFGRRMVLACSSTPKIALNAFSNTCKRQIFYFLLPLDGEVETLPVAKFLTTATSAVASDTFTVEGYVNGQEYKGFYRWPATRFDLDP